MKLRKPGSKAPDKSTKREGRPQGGPYSVEARHQAVEAYRQSGMPLKDFAKVWGVGRRALHRWKTIYAEAGMKGLEKPWASGRPSRRPGLAEPVKEAITQTKQRFPDFGLQKIKDWLWRFHALPVSTGSIRKTLKTVVLPAPASKKRWRKRPVVRTFERAKAMALWQSDITSFVLTRHSQRVYLTVFLDDYSRFIVAWALQLHQKHGMVIETLLDGIAKFGKPVEVLTDQGPQYYAWHGTSEFQRVLKREGIKHLVARTHHPQTVGKCERLWETIGQEFWARVHPQELGEARERFGHFVHHYNHGRPHQGLHGLMPADRFFGTDSQIRLALEAQLSKNELALAVGDAPEPPIFLVGQIGEQVISLHGERGHLVVHTQEGPRAISQEVKFDERTRQPGNADPAAPTEMDASDEAPARPDLSLAGPGPLGNGESRGTTPSPSHGHNPLGSVARPDDAHGGGETTGDPTHPLSPTHETSGGGVGSGPVETTQTPGQSDESDASRVGPRRSENPSPTGETVGTGEPGPAGTHPDFESDADGTGSGKKKDELATPGGAGPSSPSASQSSDGGNTSVSPEPLT